jgi:hypothetical protein
MVLTPEQIAQMDGVSGMGNAGSVDKSALFGEMDKVLGAQQVQSKPENQGFFSKTYDDLQKRADTANLTIQDYRQGNITKPEEAYQLAGNVLAGGAGDVAGNAIVSGIKTANDLTGGYAGDAISGALARGMSIPVGSSGRTVGERIQGLAQGADETYSNFSKEHPRLAANLEATGNLAMLGLPAFKRGKEVAGAVEEVGSALKKVPVMASDEIRNKGSALFELAKSQGGRASPEFFDNFINTIKEKAQKDPLVIALKKKTGNPEAYSELADVVKDFSGQPLTFERARALDEELGSLAYQNVDSFGKVNDMGRQFLDMQHTLGKMIDEAPETMFLGGKEGFETVKEAKKYWAAQSRMRDVERVMENADRYANPETVIQTGFKTLLRNGKKASLYTPQEVNAMEKAARTGVAGDLFHLMGSGLAPIGAGIAGSAVGGQQDGVEGAAIGALAALPVFALRKFSKGIAKSIQTGKAENVTREIAKRVQDFPKQNLVPALANLSGQVGTVAAPIGIQDALRQLSLSDIMKLPPYQAKQLLQDKNQWQ